MNHLKNLGNQFSISIPKDEDGYIGRECPESACKGYFKITQGTGLSKGTVCYCAYCGHYGDQKDFHTQEQIEYAKSMVIRQVEGALIKDLKTLEFDHKPKGFGFGLSMKVEPGRPHPIHYYQEKTLETHINCNKCNLRYAVYGVFCFCPDCGTHNSLQILEKSLEVAIKVLELTPPLDKDVAKQLLENTLEDCVSSFDGFGRELCRIHSTKSLDVNKAKKISFQNLDLSVNKLKEIFGIDIGPGLEQEEWNALNIGFQKRHLFSHKMGIIDNDYIKKTEDATAIVGRKITIGESEIKDMARLILKLAKYLSNEMNNLQGELTE